MTILGIDKYDHLCRHCGRQESSCHGMCMKCEQMFREGFVAEDDLPQPKTSKKEPQPCQDQS